MARVRYLLSFSSNLRIFQTHTTLKGTRLKVLSWLNFAIKSSKVTNLHRKCMKCKCTHSFLFQTQENPWKSITLQNEHLNNTNFLLFYHCQILWIRFVDIFIPWLWKYGNIFWNCPKIVKMSLFLNILKKFYQATYSVLKNWF